MVTYGDILQAFLVYAATREQSAWCDLWILCQRRIEILVKVRFSGKPPVDDFDGIVTDSTAKALNDLKQAHDLNKDAVSKICWTAYMDTVAAYFDNLAQWRKSEEAVSVINSVGYEGSLENIDIARFLKNTHGITEAQKAARRENGKKGGRPKKIKIFAEK